MRASRLRPLPLRERAAQPAPDIRRGEGCVSSYPSPLRACGWTEQPSSARGEGIVRGIARAETCSHLRLRQQHVDDDPDELDIAQGERIADGGDDRAADRPEPLPAAHG